MRVRFRCFTIAAAAISLLAVLPGAASAKDYCVAPNLGCGGTDVDTLAKALDQADDDPDADRILLGAWTYVAPTTGGFDYSISGAPVEIIGKGAGQTTLTAPSGATNVLRLFGSAASSVHDLKMQIPADAAYDSTGLSTDALARRIDVTEHPQQQQLQRHGVHLEHGGALEDSSVMLPGAGPYTNGVWIDAGGGAVRRSTIAAYSPVVSAYGGTIEQSLITTGGVALAAGGGVTTIVNSVIRLWQGGGGLVASAQPGSSSTLNADGMTIVGPDRLSARAAVATTFGSSADNADVNVTNSVIRGARLEAYAKGTGQAKVTVSYSDLDLDGSKPLGISAHIDSANTTNVGDAGFADPQLGDYHLLPGSPLIDAGDPATPAGSDMDGKPRIVDGNVDGTARRDMGAFEFQTGLPEAGPPAGGSAAGEPAGDPPPDTRAPVIGGFRATPSLFALARAATPLAARVPRGTRFRYTLSEPGRVTLRIERVRAGHRVFVGRLRRAGVKGANGIRFTGRIGRRALRPGRYRAAIVATDTSGNRSARRTARFRIAAP